MLIFARSGLSTLFQKFASVSKTLLEAGETAWRFRLRLVYLP
jgi:hypothetical protein